MTEKSDRFERELLRGSLDLMVLSVLSGEPQYGYSIQKQIREASRERVELAAGTLYPLLHRLESDRLIRSRWDDSTGRRRKWYELTAAGRQRLSQHAQDWNHYAECIRQLLPPVFQAPPQTSLTVAPMSHPEFENYLAQLAARLRASAGHRAEISDELRDHFEARLADMRFQELGYEELGGYQALGRHELPREDAVRQALAEFGDAQDLAGAFSMISHNRRKRWLMKWTTVSIGGLAAAALLTLALWPENANLKLANKAVAQAAKPAAADPAAADPVATKAEDKDAPAKSKDDNNAATEAALSKQVTAEFIEMPLADVIHYLRDLTGVEFYVNSKKLEEAGIDKQAPVTVNLKKVRVDMLLDLALAQAGDGAAYVVRDGIVIVSSADNLENATEVRVYNCRDLLKLAPPVESAMPGRIPMVTPRQPSPAGAPAFPGAPAAKPTLPGATLPTGTTPPAKPGAPGGPATGLPGAAGPTSGSGGAGTAAPAADPFGPPAPGTAGGSTPALPEPGAPGPVAGGFGPPPRSMMGGIVGAPTPPMDEASLRADRLMNIITTAVAPDSWQASGGFGTVGEYSGLLVVNHNARTHRQIEKVRAMLREAAGKDAAAGPQPSTIRH